MTTPATCDLLVYAIADLDGQHDATREDTGCTCARCTDPWLLACACGHPSGQHAANDGPCTDSWQHGGQLLPCGCPGFAPTGESLEAFPSY